MGRGHRVSLRLGAFRAITIITATTAMMSGVIGAGGCRKPPPPPPPIAVATPVTSSAAPDRLAPGELPPGQERAHDLLLPRGARVDRQFGSSVYCSVPQSPETFANWVRKQSDDPEALIGPNGTIFPKVHVHDAFPGHHLRIEISPGRQDESIVIVDSLPDDAPAPPPLSNAEAMKKVGLTPDGKWLDPKHLD